MPILSNMKTLMLFVDTGANRPVFFEINKDVSHLDGVYINDADASDAELDELHSLIYNEEGRYKLPELKQPTKDWDKFVTCGFLA